MDRRKLDFYGARASTILEVVIAMVIIVTVFGIALMIFGNVMRVSLSVQRLKAQQLLKEELIKTEQDKNATSSTMIIDSLEVDLNVADSAGLEGIQVIHLKAYDRNHHPLAELQKIIRHE